MKKKLVAIISVVAMLVTMFPATVFADDIVYEPWTSDSSLPSKGVYKLEKDVSVSGSNSMNVKGDLTIDLNGHTISLNNSGHVFYLGDDDYTLTIEDNSVEGKGKITNDGMSGSSNGLVYLTGGKLVLKGGTIENVLSHGYALYVNSGSNATIEGGNIINKGSGGYAVFINSGSSLELRNGNVVNEVSGGNAVYVNANSTFKMGGGTVSTESTYASDAAIYANNTGASITIEGGMIESNTKGIYASHTPVNVTGGEFNTSGDVFQTRYTTISPEKDEDVIINSQGALFYTFSNSNNKADGGTYNVGHIERKYTSSDEPSVTKIESGVFSVSPTDYVTGTDKAVARITNGGETKYVVGGSDTVNEKIGHLVSDGSQIGIEKGNVELTNIPEGVKITNDGDGDVTVNDTPVLDGETLCIHKWSEWMVDKQPTSTTSGEKHRTCSVCGKEERVSIPATGSTGGKPSTPSVTKSRVAGDDRFETAIKVADKLKSELGVVKFNNIVVANSDEFADALSATALAADKDAPILVVNENNESTVKNYIANNLNKGGNVYIIGGTAVVSESFEKSLTDCKVTRLGGSDRYETNLAVLKAIGVTGASDIMVASGLKYPDALSASATGNPVLLVGKTLTDNQKAYLATLGGNDDYYVIGGTAAVNATVMNQLNASKLGTVTRLGGDTRYETGLAVADEFFTNARNVVIASGDDFPDGLTGGVLANAMNAPLMLVNQYNTDVAADYVDDNSVRTVIAIGGTTVIPDATLNKVA